MRDVRAIEQSWKLIGRISAAHILMLRDAGLIGDDSAGVLLKAVEHCQVGGVPADGTLLRLITEFDERVDAISPAGYAGAAILGRGTIDVAAAVSRMRLRDDL